MMKRLLSLTLAALMLLGCALCLSGCHGTVGMAAFEVPAEFDTSREYELTFWAKNDTNVTQSRIYQQAIADFEALYPNVHVTMKLYTDYSRLYNDVITNISTGTTPNVCITYPDHIATYLTGENTVVPLDSLFADENYGLGGSALLFDSPAREEIVESFLDECSINGTYYAIPFMRSTEACYINKTYVEALGYEVPDVLTWDFVWEVSEAAMAKDAEGNFLINGQKVLIPFIYKSTDNMMIQMLQQLQSGYSDDSGNILLFNDTTKDLLLNIADHTRNGVFSTFKISSYPANFLNAGQCIFAVDSTAGATWIGSDAPLLDISPDALVEFETVVRPVPQFDTENLQMISQGPSICVFNKDDSQEVLAAWLFAQFLLTDEVQIAYASTEGYVPVTEKARQTAEYQDYLSRSGEDNDAHYFVKLDATELLLNHTENTFTTPVFNGSASLRSAAGELIESTVKGIRRSKTVDSAYIDGLYSEVTSLYRLDQLEVSSADAAADLGPLPSTAKALLASLGLAWLGIGCFVVLRAVRRKKQAK